LGWLFWKVAADAGFGTAMYLISRPSTTLWPPCRWAAAEQKRAGSSPNVLHVVRQHDAEIEEAPSSHPTGKLNVLRRPHDYSEFFQ
jgi:hypothetical protein